MKIKNWLSHLETSIPEEAKGYTVSMYSIALEGWRRGLTLKFINENRRKSELRYSLASQEREHRFVVSRGDFTSLSTLKICRDKHTTKEYLLKAGVPTPEGRVFKKEVPDEEILSYARSLDFPLVIKPSDGTGGAGVIANIKNETEFKNALSYVKYDLGFSEVIVEKFFKGIDHRVYVVGDKVMGAIIRIPANVVGDGKSTIQQLIKINNSERDKNPALFRRLIKIDKELLDMLAEKDYKLDSIPKEGERVFLKSKANISSGGDSVDVTDELTDEIKNITIQAVAAIPGLKHSGVDIIVDKENNTATIIEINTQASINSHLFPMEGVSRDIPKEIIDLYFPETKANYNKDGQLYYFDFQHMFEAFQNGYAEEYTIPPMPTGNITTTRFIVEGKIQNVAYEVWVRNQAKKLKLHGYVKNLLNGTTSIVVSGNTENIDEFRKKINSAASKRAVVSNVKELSRTSPVKIGFEILAQGTKNNEKSSKTSLQTGQTLQEGYFPVKIDDVRIRRKRVSK
ncbi:acylphosphatase [Oceanobacillus polygoni]|uniref:Acylphosphatase n=1 Tax=Oceanobacillus polygoni TaxID=1235259 RepID=A0A9X0YQT5_9BACI|nr:acylphosphatase [Oceanobacillus polygoni]MBP2076162.1 D-alanine-D-alanine ligase-like ATP-grasp enzyme/acylphosphatase [Oceanobacillus polygoni]